MDCKDAEVGWIQLRESFECHVTESLFYTLGGRQGEHRTYYLDWNNFEKKGGTVITYADNLVLSSVNSELWSH